MKPCQEKEKEVGRCLEPGQSHPMCPLHMMKFCLPGLPSACHCEVVTEFLNLLGLHMQLLLYLLNHLHLTPQGFVLLPPSRQGCEQPLWVLAAYQGSTTTAGVQTAGSRGF